jgi:hypothetical protein
VFAHTPLILNQEGKKLSKRDGVTSIGDFQAMGYAAEALANYMTLLGWSPPEGMDERFTLEQAAAVFGFERVNKAGARFDWDKLNWLNGQVLHGQGPAALRDQLLRQEETIIFALMQPLNVATAAEICKRAPIASVNTSIQTLYSGDSLTVTFRGIGGGCGAGNFKVIESASSTTNSRGYLTGTTTNVTLSSNPSWAENSYQRVTYIRLFADSDVGRYFQ